METDHRRTSFVFVDATYTHDGTHRAWDDWDFYNKPPHQPDAPQNWMKPVDYVNGEFQLRVEVLAMKETPMDVGYAIGFCNLEDDADELHCHTQPSRIRFRRPGVYEASARTRDMWFGVDAGTLGFEVALEAGWDWRSWGGLYSFVVPYGCDPFPINFHVTWTIYAAKVQAPSFNPAAGTFGWPVHFMVGTPTPMPDVHYTLDGSEPTRSSPRFEKPFILERSLSVTARGFKEGWDPSDIVRGEFIRE